METETETETEIADTEMTECLVTNKRLRRLLASVPQTSTGDFFRDTRNARMRLAGRLKKISPERRTELRANFAALLEANRKRSLELQAEELEAAAKSIRRQIKKTWN